MAFDLTPSAPQRVAIIGGGISGLSAAWQLSKHHHVTVFEADRRWGGHARTVLAGRRGDQPVDTGFIVFNYVTYPHLTRLFQDLDIPVERSDMSFAVSANGGRFEYALSSLDSLFGQRRNLLNPGFYGLLRDITRFNAKAEEAASNPRLTIDELTEKLGLSDRFRDHYLRPFCGAIWSTPANRIGAFPAQSLVNFLRNHALLSATGQHQWWTVSGGSKSYVLPLIKSLQSRGVDLRPGAVVTRVERTSEAATIRGPKGEAQSFDQIVFACHADMALKLLDQPTAAETAALGAVQFQDNHIVLHKDHSVMPNRRRCWASWVYKETPGASEAAPLGASYWMNKLQNIPQDDPLFVTLNGASKIRDEDIYDTCTFRHPVFDHRALRAQGEIDAVQGRNRTWFAGAWLRNGFHEDGVASAMRIARRLVTQTV